MAPDGQLALPADVATVGWYVYSPAPGATAGSTVIAGHVDSAVQGVGALFALRAAKVGDRIRVLLASGAAREFRVVRLAVYRKTALPAAALFTLTGPPVLTVVTCGGRFDRTRRSYDGNVVVTAAPAG